MEEQINESEERKEMDEAVNEMLQKLKTKLKLKNFKFDWKIWPKPIQSGIWMKKKKEKKKLPLPVALDLLKTQIKFRWQVKLKINALGK